MRIRYYVLAKGNHFDVFREGVHKGEHVLRSRAIEAAITMARLETRFAGTPTEILLEESDGQFRPSGHFDPPIAPAALPRQRAVGETG